MVAVGKPELHQRIALLQVRIETIMIQEPRQNYILPKVSLIDRSDCIPEELVSRKNVRLSDVPVAL